MKKIFLTLLIAPGIAFGMNEAETAAKDYTNARAAVRATHRDTAWLRGSAFGLCFGAAAISDSLPATAKEMLAIGCCCELTRYALTLSAMRQERVAVRKLARVLRNPAIALDMTQVGMTLRDANEPELTAAYGNRVLTAAFVSNNNNNNNSDSSSAANNS